MSYIKITNDGEINVNAFRLLGASTKRGDSEKIGFFGTGNKYALGYFLKNNIDVRVFSGENEITISTEFVEFDGSSFDVIAINGEQTSITTDIGPTWEAWHAIREFYSNAMDCGGSSIEMVDEVSEGDSGLTSIYIDASSHSVSDVVDNLDLYFAGERKVLLDRGGVKVYANGTGTIFRKGIKVNGDKALPSKFDYDIESLNINEMRVLSHSWQAPEKIADAIFGSDDIGLINDFICSFSEGYEETLFNNSMVSWPRCFSESVKEWFKENLVAVSAMKSMLTKSELVSAKMLPDGLFRAAIEKLSAENMVLPTKLGASGTAIYKELEMHRSEADMIKSSIDSLAQAGIVVDYPCVIAEFEDSRIMGMADRSRNVILIARDVFDMGQIIVMSTILEEFFHIRDGVDDETREMQDCILNALATVVNNQFGQMKQEAA